MLGSRRRALFAFFSVSGVCFFIRSFALAQNPKPNPPKLPGEEQNPDSSEPPANSTKAILEQNQKEMKKQIEKLYDLVTQLKEEVEKTNSSAVLSIPLFKKAEEVEKLARQIKERARG